MEAASILHPRVAAWLEAAHGAPTPPQEAALEAHASGEHVLIASPTGTGKTLAGFLGVISDLHRTWDAGELGDGIQCLYVSPLKALNVDVARSVQGPLDDIARRMRDGGEVPPPLRVGVRTGDTSERERAAQRVAPPHILATTPETLAILLNAPRLRHALARVRHVIVDEAHALAGTKRGAHLALSLERLESLVEGRGGPPPRRVGLSASAHPLEAVARFVAGTRPVRISQTPVARGLELRVVTPVPDLLDTTPETYEAGLLDLLHDIVQRHQTTLVFTSTRRAAERVVQGLCGRFPEYVHALEETDSTDPAFVAPDAVDALAPHHGSMSRDERSLVEMRLQRGEARCVVASASLELGIDAGSVDHVVLLGSPRDPARALQRIGRSGHRIGATRRAMLVALDPDDLAESLALADRIQHERLEPLPETPEALDVLAQHLCGLVLEQPMREADAQRVFSRAGAYAALTVAVVERVAAALAEEGLVARDGRGRWAPGPRFTRMRLWQNMGTIPSSRNVRVRHGLRFVGDLEGAFAEALAPGDVLQLGGRAWRLVRSQGGAAWVEPAPGETPTMPRWMSEGVPLGVGMAQEAAEARSGCHPNGSNGNGVTVARAGVGGSVAGKLCHCLTVTAGIQSTMRAYRRRQALWAGTADPDVWPTETFLDEDAQRVTVFHLPGGRAANEAIARTLAHLHGAAGHAPPRVLGGDLGFALMTRKGDHPAPKILLQLARQADPAATIEAAAAGSARFQRRLRHVVERFLLARTLQARGSPAQAAARLRRHMTDAASPLRQEALREVLHEAWDLAGALLLLKMLRDGERRLGTLRKLPAPSPFALGLLHRGEPAPSTERVAAWREGWLHVEEALAHRASRRK